MILTESGADELQSLAPTWLAAPDHPQAAPTIVIQRDGVALHWRPGRALIAAPKDQHADILAALVEFAFYEGELRALEQKLDMKSADAEFDVLMAYRIRYRDRAHWPVGRWFPDLIFNLHSSPHHLALVTASRIAPGPSGC